MDETYIKVRGEWVCLYRAADKAGKTVDFFLSRERDTNALPRPRAAAGPDRRQLDLPADREK